MLSKYISPGDKLELSAVQNSLRRDASKERKVYKSKVYDIVSEDEIKLVMPTEKGKLVLLPVGSEYDLCFYALSGSLYQCTARVGERYRSNNVYMVTMELTSSLRKFQRREYYRLNCVVDMKCSSIADEKEDNQYQEVEVFETDITLQDGVIVDISGGGVRFISNEEYEKEAKIRFMFILMIEGKPRQYNVVGKVISSAEIDGKPGQFENRVQFLNLEDSEREGIIRYVFEEERKIRRKEKY